MKSESKLRMKPTARSHDDSLEMTAVAALNFLAADQERLERFLSITGLGPHSLRRAAADPAFFRSVLEYIASNEELLVAFAQNERRAPAEITQMLPAPD